MALDPAARRASRPAAGWNIATPSPDSSSSVQTRGYVGATPARPAPVPASATPTGDIQGRRRRSAMTPNTSCGSELPSAAAMASPAAPT
ncbi:hypothetical protein GCM10027610_004210 [Dactylosporangium cerinum]